MQASRVFAVCVGAGALAGALMLAINIVVVQSWLDQLADHYTEEFLLSGDFGEEEFDQMLANARLQNLGLPMAYGVLGGVLVTVAYLRVRKDAFKVALVVAGAAWFSLYVMPAAKYPANPDTLFNPEGDGGYFALFAGYSAASGLAALGSAVGFAKTKRRNWYIGAAGVYLGIIGALYFVFPAFPELEPVPKELLVGWQGGIAAGVTAMWFTLGIVSGALLEREEKKGKTQPAAESK